MARKSDSQKPPIAVWVASTRRTLGLSAGSVAAVAGIAESSLRKIEGGSAQPGRDTLWRIWKEYQRIGLELGRPVGQPPTELHEEISADQGSLAEAIRDLAGAIRELQTRWERQDEIDETVAQLWAEAHGAPETPERVRRGARKGTTESET